MASGVVTVGRNRYATGLYWENSPGSGRVAQIAREAANQPGQQAAFYAVRPGNKNGRIPQFGLSGGDAGQAAGMPSLAGCLAGQIPGSWAGAFRMSEGVAVIVVRDDLIVPDGDLFFLDEAEARDRLIQEIGFGGLQNTYAPESWSIAGADTVPLTLLLNDRKDVKLQAVQLPPRVKIVIAGGVVFFLIVVGGIWYWQNKVAEADALAAQQEAMRRAQAMMHGLPSALQQQMPPEPKYDRVWEAAPSPLAVLNACAAALPRIQAFVAGWRLAQMKCTGNAVTMAWTREKGMSSPPPGALVNENATSASQVLNLPPLAPRGPETLLPVDQVTQRYLEQNWPGPVARIANDPPPKPPAGYTGPWSPPAAPWVKRSFTLTVPIFPGEVAAMIGDLPGAIVTSINYTPNGNWNIEGVIYENRQ